MSDASKQDREVEKLKRRIAGLEKTIQIITGHSGRVEKDLKALFDAVSVVLPAPLMVNAKDGKILFFNEKAMEIFGFTEEDYKTVNAEDLYEHGEDRDRFLSELAERGELDGFVVNLKGLDGNVFPASLHTKEIEYEGRAGVLTVVHDLSVIRSEEAKRLALEKQLRQTQKMEAVGAMAAGIAHDFNNILTVFFGKLQLALLALSDQEKTTSLIKDALRAADRAKDITAQILAFCRPRGEENEPFKIHLVVSDAFKMVRSIVSTNINLTLSLNDVESEIIGNPAHVHQVVVNLVNNAGYALKDTGGNIEISLSKIEIKTNESVLVGGIVPGHYVLLKVEDDGPGIAADVIDRVFEPFFTTKPFGEGSGMGLAVVHGILKGCGGCVNIKSSPGNGAELLCYFPVALRALESEMKKMVKEAIGRGNNEKILLVDDELDILEAYKELLENRGYSVTIRQNTTDALDNFRKDPYRFDLVITDHSMPVMAGGTMATEMLKLRPDMPIIMITGGEDPTIYNLGLNAVIGKPFSNAELEGAIQRALRHES